MSPAERLPLQGEGFDSNVILQAIELEIECKKVMSTCSTLAFDRKISTTWIGDCTHNGCARGSNFVGQYLGIYGKEVKCYKILQSGNPAHATNSIAMESWNGAGSWELRSVENDFGMGTWNRRPALPLQMWRLTNSVATPFPWRVTDVKFYKDIHCALEIMDATPLGSDVFDQNTIFNAFDNDNRTYWQAACDIIEGCDRHKGWIGMQRTKNHKDKLEASVVKCIRINQDRNNLYQSKSLKLETWNGERWAKPPKNLQTQIDYTGLGGGSLQARPGMRASKWILRAP